MIIYNKQIDAISIVFLEKLKRTICEDLKNNDSYKTIEYREIIECVNFGFSQANRYKLNDDEAIVSYIKIVLQNGKNFEDDPKFKDLFFKSVLSSTNLSDNEKINFIIENLQPFNELS